MSQTLAVWSNDLVYAAMAAFVVAMLACAAEAGFGSRGAVSRRLAGRQDARDREPVTVGAGGPSPTTGPPQRPVEGAAGVPSPPSLADRLGRAGVSAAVLGTVLLALGVVLRGAAAGRPPWGNMYEFALVGCTVAASAFLVALRRYPVRGLAVWVIGTVLLTLGLAVAVLYVPAGPLVPALRSYWLVLHVLAATVAAALFTVAMVASALHLVQATAERRGVSGGYLSRLPAAARLDALAYRLTAFAFPVWTFAIIGGAIWAESSWGRFWGWDPKETWSLVTWLVYAAYLHARTTAGWRGTKASVVALVGYATLIFNFFGVNIFFSGLHSYGGV